MISILFTGEFVFSFLVTSPANMHYRRDAAAIMLERTKKRVEMKKYLESTKPIHLGQSILLEPVKPVKPVLKRARSLPVRFTPGKVVRLADLK